MRVPSRHAGTRSRLGHRRLLWNADRYRTPPAEAFIELAGEIGKDLAERIAGRV